MKLISVLILFIIFSSPFSSFALDSKTEDSLHFGISGIFGAVSETYLHYNTDMSASSRVVSGTFLGSVPGLFKELIDSSEPDGNFNGSDMALNIGGAFVGSLIANHINSSIVVRRDQQKNVTAILLNHEF